MLMNNEITGTFSNEDAKIKDCMAQLKVGKLKIPNFQRDYVWDSSKIVRLLNSISFGYPIGLITSAKSGGRVFKGKNEVLDRILMASGEKQKVSGDMIIDGQQRITSLAIVYFINILNPDDFKEDSIRKKVKAVRDNICFTGKKFYLRKDLKSILSLQDKSKDDIKYELDSLKISNENIHDQVISLIENYPLAFSVLTDWTNKEVIKIFGAINSGSKPLTYVDLASSSIYAQNESFDLLTIVKKFNSKRKDFGSISSETYLQLLKVYSDITFYNNKKKIKYTKDAILSFASDKEAVDCIINDHATFEKMIIDTFDYLDDNYGFTTYNSIPNNAFIFTVFYFMTTDKEYIVKDKDATIKKFLRHVLSRTISNDYAAGTQSKIMDDIEKYQINQFGDEVEGNNLDWFTIKENFSKLSYDKPTNALYKVAIATMAMNAPKNLFKMGSVKIAPSLFSKKDTDQHHFIPKKSDEVSRLGLVSEDINKVSNILIISAKENREKIRNRDFKEYIEEIKKLSPDDFATKMDSHYLDIRLVNKIIDAKNDDVLYEYIKELWIKRASLIMNAIKKKYTE